MTAFPRHNWEIDAAQPVNRLCSLNRGLVAWWLGIPGWTGGRRLVDITSPGPNGNHGTATNSPPWSVGKGGSKSLSFSSGSSQYVGLGSTDYGGDQGTIAAWVKPGFSYDAGSPFQRYVVSTTGIGTRGIALYYKPTSSFQWYGLYRGSFGGTAAPAGKSFSSDADFKQWQHVTFTWDASGSHFIYDNGVPGTEDTTSCNAWGGNTAWRIACGDYFAYPTSVYWDGHINDVRIWSRALLPREVAVVYRDSLQGYPQTLKRVSQPVFPAAAAAGFGGTNQILGGGIIVA